MKKFFLLLALTIYIHSVSAQCTSIDANKINTLTDKVSKQHLDNNKIKIIQDYLNTDCIKSTQLITLLKFLNFEEDKITIIKKAYSKLEDPQNISEIFKLLEFESSKKEIQTFIQGLK
ncbi:MAG: hypothetical protein RLZZ414_554 [Bacteroidota bacterium]|jgi:hypothetical protein